MVGVPTYFKDRRISLYLLAFCRVICGALSLILLFQHFSFTIFLMTRQLCHVFVTVYLDVFRVA